ncbi:hypothetical protein EsDP_00006314 [Epichloe bromicola]|uniref:Uncharacterized protein n=1 Tax=Epichloe bromicola TaxID=79588 RepID=A0ABQ0CXF3_9HYPO
MLLNKITTSALALAAFAIASSLIRGATAMTPGIKVCYNRGATSQNLTVEHIKYAASYLRYRWKLNRGKAASFYILPKGLTRVEWPIDIPDPASVIVMAEQVNASITSATSLLDIANAIDGGENASEDEKKAALIGCGEHGGQMVVVLDDTFNRYNDNIFKNQDAEPDDCIVKLIRNTEYPY